MKTRSFLVIVVAAVTCAAFANAVRAGTPDIPYGPPPQLDTVTTVVVGPPAADPLPPGYTEMQTDVKKLQGDVGRLNGAVGTLNTRVGNVEQTQAQMAATQDKMATAINTLAGKTIANEQQINAVGKGLADLSTKMDNLPAQINVAVSTAMQAQAAQVPSAPPAQNVIYLLTPSSGCGQEERYVSQPTSNYYPPAPQYSAQPTYCPAPANVGNGNGFLSGNNVNLSLFGGGECRPGGRVVVRTVVVGRSQSVRYAPPPRCR
jgi:hypothetical protein